MPSPISLSFATTNMSSWGNDTYYFSLIQHLKAAATHYQLSFRDDYGFIRTDPAVPDHARYFDGQICGRVVGSATLAVRSIFVDALVSSCSPDSDRVTLANGVVLPLLPFFQSPTDIQGAAIVWAPNSPAVLILWTEWISTLQSMYEILNHEIQHSSSTCPCTVPRSVFSLSDGPFRSASSRSSSLPPVASRDPSPLPQLGGLDTLSHLTDLSKPSSKPKDLHPLGPFIHDTSIDAEFYQLATQLEFPLVDLDRDSVISLLQMPAGSPISSVSSPPSTCCSPQTIFDGSPVGTSDIPGSPFDPDMTSPSSLGSDHKDDFSEDGSDNEADAATHSTKPAIQRTEPSPSPVIHAAEGYFTFPMPSTQRRPTGGKAKVFPTTTEDWRKASASALPAAPARPRNKSLPSTTHPSPSESVRRNVRIASGTTPSGAFASMRLSSPAQPHAGPSLHSPARVPNGVYAHYSARMPTGSTPPRRAALIATEAISSMSDEEHITYTTAMMDDYDEDDEDEDDYSHHHHNGANLSPKSLASKTGGTKRKKRRSGGGGASQKKQKFACDDCAATFTREADMRRHRNTACKKAAAVDSMTCQYCQVPFNRGDALNRHIRTKHRNIVAAA
ncbi:hypothetical protein EIP91_010255 [Steccherinum ochraceum]|uniref:C2H2-type domain-containing protein n=1 Tax=Steccherinum ochraceum TaxID=92696 RepID=A0A4R0RD28_9APHY|nr:hypothetical protein EIP91_010255 [Steccherinum ochraceum]